LGYLTVADLVDNQLGTAAFEYQRSGSLVLPSLHGEARLKGNRSHIWIPFASVDDQQAVVGQGHRTICASIPVLDDKLDDFVIVKVQARTRKALLPAFRLPLDNRPTAWPIPDVSMRPVPDSAFGIERAAQQEPLAQAQEEACPHQLIRRSPSSHHSRGYLNVGHRVSAHQITPRAAADQYEA
jgi:hypothetical protein